MKIVYTLSLVTIRTICVPNFFYVFQFLENLELILVKKLVLLFMPSPTNYNFFYLTSFVLEC